MSARSHCHLSSPFLFISTTGQTLLLNTPPLIACTKRECRQLVVLWYVHQRLPSIFLLRLLIPFKWASGHDETVEVNQRALIDKVLARYSGEFTGTQTTDIVRVGDHISYILLVFRELLQNSDDAASRAVEIRFETKEYLDRMKKEKDAPGNEQEQADDVVHELSCAEGKLPDLKTALVHQWTFRNNGMVFKDDDWNRLKKIGTHLL